MKQWKKVVAAAISMTLLVQGNFSGNSKLVSAESLNKLSVAGGWNETLYAEWEEMNAEGATVSYKASTDDTYTTLTAKDADLIRQEDEDTARIDIPGLAAGTYDLMVTTSEGNTFTASDIKVKEHDRSGYAHYKYTRGIGAYNDDGTLKEDAIVLYVTDENKDTIQVPGYESYATGIGYILNGNTELMQKIVADGHALAIRFIGTVNVPEGLTAYNSTVNGGTVGDNGNMAIIKMSKDVTLEGIGTDATINGWGFSFYVGDKYENRESYEVRNLTFKNYTEDAVGFQGFMSDSKTLSTPIERVWVHNNSFYPGYCENPAESDKKEGDGSCDFKRGKYYTMSYNYYNNCHKTNLIGASDSNLQFNMTLHHNFYDNCGSRSPLARQANIHIYNSYFKGNTAKTVDARANAYILSEANYYETCKNPMLTQSGAVIKSVGDIVYNCLDANTAVVAENREDQVASSNTYPNFDTNESIFYYDSENKVSDVSYLTSAAQAKADCIAFSGVMKPHDQIVDTAKEASIIENEPENAVVLPYSISFTDKTAADYAGNKMVEAGIKMLTPSTPVVMENVVFNSASKYNTTGTSLKLRSQGITFKVAEQCKLTMTEPEGTGKFALVVYNQYGQSLLNVENGTGSVTLEAGTYTIQSSNAEKDAYIETLSITSTGEVVEPTVAPTTEPTAEPTTEPTVEPTVAPTTEPTAEPTVEPTVAPTTEPTVEPTVVPTEPAQSETAVAMGTYELNKSTLSAKKTSYANMSFDVRDVLASSIKVRKANTITFSVDQACELTIEGSGAGVTITTEDGAITDETTTANTASVSALSTYKVQLTPGTYTVNGYSSSNNTVITSFDFK